MAAQKSKEPRVSYCCSCPRKAQPPELRRACGEAEESFEGFGHSRQGSRGLVQKLRGRREEAQAGHNRSWLRPEASGHRDRRLHTRKEDNRHKDEKARDAFNQKDEELIYFSRTMLV